MRNVYANDNDMSYELTINGYYRDNVRGFFPEVQAIYFVYRGAYKPSTRWAVLKEIIFVGDSDNLREDVNDDTRRMDFLERCQYGECLFYSYSVFKGKKEDRHRVVAALVTELQPPLNKDTLFRYPETEVLITGERMAFLPKRLIVLPQ